MTTIDLVRKMLLVLAVSLSAGILFVNVYTSVVDARNWSSAFPASIEAARHYFTAANPGTFFRVVSPANQLFALLALVACWKASPQVRVFCILALVAAVATDGMTFGYFYPRNNVLFTAPMADTGAMKQALDQWVSMNWVRSAGVLANLGLNFAALLSLTSR